MIPTRPSHATQLAARVRLWAARASLLLALAVLSIGWPADALAQAAGRAASERSVKAAFLYKFASYVEWPDSEIAGDAPLVIGVISGGDFARELTEITTGRFVSSRPIVVRRLDEDEPVDGVNILFVGDEERGALPRVLAAAGLRPILTVTESDGAIASGAVINFTLDAERVRFEVSLYAAEMSNLKLNARLLAVAQQVYREPE